MGFWGVVNNSIKNSDIILLIMDARVPHESMNSEVLKKAEKLKKEVVCVFNKSDLISKAEVKRLNEQYPNSFFVSAKMASSTKKIRKYLDAQAQGREKSLRVSLIGYPNVGKSSIFNRLVPEAKAKVSSISGSTKKTEWIRSKDIRFMDTPGVIPMGDSAVKVGITASKDPHKIQDPDKVAMNIIRKVRKKDESILEKFYGIGIGICTGKEDYEVFEMIGEAKKFLVKKGEIDEHRTAIKIIEDWQKGKLGLKK